MMKYEIVISDEAKSDIKEAVDYYSQIDNKLPKRCIADIVAAIDKLKQNPLHYQVRYKNIRIIFTTTFPYGIHYILDENIIFILRVFHTKRFFK